jgi:3-hydroxyisobutyrate dehydrogenase-like beta-hydroxyacid dehydrogenase
MDIGFIGLGAMGRPMAANLLKAGHRLTIFDTRRASGEALEAAGAVWADTPEATAGGADIVLSSLPGPAEIEATALGPDGIFDGLRPGGIYVDLSTNAPAVIRKIADVGGARGFRVLDAPVTGGVAGAAAGRLTIYVGGEATDYAVVLPVLQCLGSTILHTGRVGSGNVVKLVNNMMAFVNLLAAAEGLATATRAGVDPTVLIEAVKGGSGNSWVWERVFPLLLEGRSFGFAASLVAKDARLAGDLARSMEVPTVLSTAAEARLAAYRDLPPPGRDMLDIVRDFLAEVAVPLGHDA